MNTRAPRARRAARAARGIAATMLAVALVACSNDQQLADITTIAPPVTEPATTTTPSATDATTPTDATDATDATGANGPAVDTTVEATVPETTAAGSTVGPDPGITGPMFSDALGVKVDTAPGVNTPGDTRQLLPEGLYVHIAWQADPNDPSVFTARDEDIEILEAYANAATTFYRAAMSEVTTDDPDFDRFFTDGGEKYDAAFAEARAGGFVKDLGEGVVLRPYVLGDNRDDSSAIVFDCALSDEQWVNNTTSSDAADPQRLGTVATLVRGTDSWIVESVSAEGSACL